MYVAVDENDANQFDEPESVEECPLSIDASVLQTIRCAAHDVQLSVSDVFKDQNLQKQLTKVRDLVKILRKLPYVSHFREKGRKKPFLDNDTRWGSKYRMVECIGSQMDHIRSLLSDELNERFDDEFWNFVSDFIESVKPVFILTKRIQEQNLTCGDFYLYWYECVLHLTELKTPLADQLVIALDQRKHMWFKNKAFLAALYVDVRLNCFNPPILSQDEKEVAMVSINLD